MNISVYTDSYLSFRQTTYYLEMLFTKYITTFFAVVLPIVAISACESDVECAQYGEVCCKLEVKLS